VALFLAAPEIKVFEVIYPKELFKNQEIAQKIKGAAAMMVDAISFEYNYYPGSGVQLQYHLCCQMHL